MSAKVPAAAKSFHFWGCAELRESLGQRAESERQLLERIENVPAESLHFHTVRVLLRQEPGPFANDFAAWVAQEVRDQPLAERLALISPFDFGDIEAFRQHLLDTLDDHLTRLPFAPRALGGQEFHFLRSHLHAVPLEFDAVDLRSFRESLARVDASSIYFHVVESLARQGRNDFSTWLDQVLGLPGMAWEIQRLDVLVSSLEGLREQILASADAHLGAETA